MDTIGVNLGVDLPLAPVDSLGVPPPKTSSQGPTKESVALARRVEQAVELSGESAGAIALKAGMARTSITNAIRGLRSGEKSTMTSTTINAIARAAGVDPGWLTTGVGEPHMRPSDGVALRFHPGWSAALGRVQAAHRELPPLAFDEVGSRVLADPSDPIDEELLYDLAKAWYRRASREELRIADTRSAQSEVERLRSARADRPGTKR